MSNNYKEKLKGISSRLHCELLKPNGFKKRSNTFNKKLPNGIVQVINLQAGQYIDSKYTIPFFRESLYGKFTINIGVYIPEIDLGNCVVGKKFINEYDCQIRARLFQLKSDTDKWWELFEKDNIITRNMSKRIYKEIKGLFSEYAFNFFENLSSRELVLKNRVKYNTLIINNPRWQLDDAMIFYSLGSLEECITKFQRHYNKTENESHKEYLIEIANKLKITEMLDL